MTIKNQNLQHILQGQTLTSLVVIKEVNSHNYKFYLRRGEGEGTPSRLPVLSQLQKKKKKEKRKRLHILLIQ